MRAAHLWVQHLRTLMGVGLSLVADPHRPQTPFLTLPSRSRHKLSSIANQATAPNQVGLTLPVMLRLQPGSLTW